MNRENAQRVHDQETAFFQEANKAAINDANLTLRTAVLINGGATIAVLGFIGAVLTRQDKFDFPHINAVSQSMIWFCYGVVLAIASMALAYLTNYSVIAISNSRLRTWEHPFITPGPRTRLYKCINAIFHMLAIAAAFCSIIFFVFGMYAVRDSVSNLAPTSLTFFSDC